VDGDRLHCSAPKGVLTPTLQAQLAERKPEILTFLNQYNFDRLSARYQPLPTLTPNSAERYEPFPLNEMQQAYWIGRNSFFEGGNVAIHVYTEIESTDLDLERFNLAWQKLVERHDMLRAIVHCDGQQQVLEQGSSLSDSTVGFAGTRLGYYCLQIGSDSRSLISPSSTN
jgi:hypothetical protein